MSILHLLCSPNLSPPCHSFRSCRPRVHIRSHGLAAANHRASLAGRPEYVPNRIHDANYIRILDTTLRDGEQSPGASMSSAQKLVLARQLAVLGVDVIEAGFPAASTDDFDAVRSIAIEVGNTPLGVGGHVPVIGGFCRCTKGDIDAAWDAVRHARRPRITAFLATSEIHMQHKLRKTPEQVVAIARDMVAYARALGCPDVEFIAEDSGRSNKEFLYHILEKVIQAGATTITIADTVGSSLPFEFGKLIADVKANTPGIDNAIISAHCHNDLGLASANTIAGAYAGARQLEVTINGIGERAGNASLEEVVMALKCRRELLHDIYTGINTQHITTTSKMVQEYSGLHVQPHKAIVGANAFAHASGIHQDGMLKYKGTYEIISPDDIGLKRVNNSGIVLGKLSGRHAVKSILVELGYEISDNEFEDFFKRYKEAADKKKRITDEDIQALLSGGIFKPRVMWSLVDVQATCGTLGSSTATVKLLTLNGEEKIGCSVGTSPIDAAYKAIDQIIQIPTILGEYNMTTEGVDAISTTRVVITADVSNNEQALIGQHIKNRAFSGTGAAKDVILSSVRAYMSALNKMSNFIDARRSGSEALQSTSVQTKEELGFAVLVSADQ